MPVIAGHQASLAAHEERGRRRGAARWLPLAVALALALAAWGWRAELTASLAALQPGPVVWPTPGTPSSGP